MKNGRIIMSQQREENNRDWNPEELVEQWIPEPDNPNVRRLVGFLMGRSHRADYWRLYLNAELNHYLEFRQEDTIHAKQLASGRTVVWVKPDSVVREITNRVAPVEFLEGDISNTQLPRMMDISGLRQALGIQAAGCGNTSQRTCANCTNTRDPFCETSVGYTCPC
jgi:hypothetical protein